jgi:hypothetical protein
MLGYSCFWARFTGRSSLLVSGTCFPSPFLMGWKAMYCFLFCKIGIGELIIAGFSTCSAASLQLVPEVRDMTFDISSSNERS